MDLSDHTKLEIMSLISSGARSARDYPCGSGMVHARFTPADPGWHRRVSATLIAGRLRIQPISSARPVTEKAQQALSISCRL